MIFLYVFVAIFCTATTPPAGASDEKPLTWKKCGKELTKADTCMLDLIREGAGMKEGLSKKWVRDKVAQCLIDNECDLSDELIKMAEKQEDQDADGLAADAPENEPSDSDENDSESSELEEDESSDDVVDEDEEPFTNITEALISLTSRRKRSVEKKDKKGLNQCLKEAYEGGKKKVYQECLEGEGTANDFVKPSKIHRGHAKALAQLDRLYRWKALLTTQCGEDAVAAVNECIKEVVGISPEEIDRDKIREAVCEKVEEQCFKEPYHECKEMLVKGVPADCTCANGNLETENGCREDNGYKPKKLKDCELRETRYNKKLRKLNLCHEEFIWPAEFYSPNDFWKFYTKMNNYLYRK